MSISNGKYTAFSADVQQLINNAAHIYVSISSNSDGSSLVNDNTGVSVSKRLITAMNYTYPHIDQSTGQEVLGGYKISFSDGTFFEMNDNNTGYWYLLEGLEPHVYKQLV
uniref:Uncharacterized protein n=1 Tax=viral metagenome TaxID=1070528 RepID=A0A6C0B869_9ZZZZ